MTDENLTKLTADLTAISGIEARDLGASDIAALRALFEDERYGLYLFASLIFGLRLKPEIHLPICQFYSRWGQSVLANGEVITTPPSGYDDVRDSWRRLMLRVPRDTLKTSVCTRAGSLWTLARDPLHDETILVVNEKAENAQRWTGAIARVVESNYLFQTLWREMIPKGIGYWDRDKGVTRPRNWKWGDTGLLFERNNMNLPELSIEPHGVGSAITGKHFTRKVLDDVIGEEAQKSLMVMESVIHWVDNSRPLESPAENGCEIVVHTPKGYSDVYAHMLKKWPGEYKTHVRHQLEDTEGKPDHINGESIWPEKLSTAKCHKMMNAGAKGFYFFMSEYQCIPRAGTDQSFDDNWFHYGQMLDIDGAEPVFKIDAAHYEPSRFDPTNGDPTAPNFIPLAWMDKCLIFDTAPSRDSAIRKEPHSDNALVLVGKDPWNRRYLLDAWGGRDNPVAILHRLMAMCNRWSCSRVAVEEVAMSAWVRPLFEQIIRYQYDWIPSFQPVRPKGRAKKERIRTLVGPVQSGFWYFNRPTCAAVAIQLGEFPYGQKNDLIDALSYTDEVTQPTESPDQLRRRWYQERHQDRGDTGYGVFY